MKKLSHFIKYVTITFFSMALNISTASASSVVEADKLYSQKKYEQARIAYIEAAKLGSPHAYYQLGTIYYEGQGTPADWFSALIWFSLASEYKLSDSEFVTNNLINSLSEEKRNYAQKIVNTFKNKHGKQMVMYKYLPEIIIEKLNKRIIFNGEEKLNQWHTPDVLSGDDEINKFHSTNNGFIKGGDTIDDEELWDDVIGEFYVRTAFNYLSEASSAGDSTPDLFNSEYFAVFDYDVASDGSVRYINTINSIGTIRNALYDLSITEFPVPTFEGKPVTFINRSYSGIASYDRITIKEKRKRLYTRSRRLVKSFENSEDIRDRYQYAKTLLTYNWLYQEEGEAIALLKDVAEEGLPEAQYEYGLHLYREQIDIKKAIEWISLAAQFGFPDAQYRLAKILEESPWVIKDEKKALIWYEQAAQHAHTPSAISSAKLKLLAADQSLHDEAGALQYLESVKSVSEDNPEYYYLTAISYLDGDNRNMLQLFKYMRLAIRKANSLHWDTSFWENQLDKWSGGTVKVYDVN